MRDPIAGRRDFLRAGAATGLILSGAALAQLTRSGAGGTSVRSFGATPVAGRDNTRAIQQAIDDAARRGGGIVLIDGTFECGLLNVSGDNVTLRGADGWLVNARIVVPPGRRGTRIENLAIVDRRGNAESYALDVSGENCTFDKLTLVKDPIAGGYQMYLRQSASHCHFSGLRLKGSNGIMVAGHDHLFEDFELESTMSQRVGGDDAFAIKALGRATYNIIIRNGVVRGFFAIASFGSEIGTEGRRSNGEASVRNVLVSDVTADRCGSLAFFKPGALIYDWRDGIVDGVRLERLRLVDEKGERFTHGVRMIAGRGATVRNVVGRQLEIRARARNQGVQATAAIDLSLLQGANGRLEDIDLDLRFTDPFGGARHGPAAPGYPIDHIARIERVSHGLGVMRNISLNIDGRGSRFGGVYVGAGLDGVVTLRRANLQRVGLDPPASVGGGGIWSDSRLQLGDVAIDSPVLPKFGGRALANRR